MLEGVLRQHFDRWFVLPLVKRSPIKNPLMITFFSVLFGLLVLPMLIYNQVALALMCLLLSGYCDVLDGALARYQKVQNNLGCFFDILADRVVESIIIISLFLVDPSARSLMCLLMMASILLCITVFLLIGVFEVNRQTNKSFFYSVGLVERFEAFVFFALMIFFPQWFFVLSLMFVVLVLLTVFQHVLSFLSLKMM